MTTSPPYARALAALDLLLLAFGFGVVAATPFGLSGDANARFSALDGFLSGGGVDGSGYSIVGPLFAAPLWWQGKATGDAIATVLFFNWSVLAIACVLMFLALRKPLGSQLSARFLMILLFASAFPHEVQSFNNEVLSALMIGGGLIALACLRGTSVGLGSLGIIVGTVNMPGIAVGSALAAVRFVFHDKRMRWLLIPLGCALGVWAEAYWRRGSPWLTGYEGNAGFKTRLPYSGLPGFSYPFGLGVLSILFSFGKGLLFFYPGLFVPARRWLADRNLRVLYESWVLVVVGLVLVYARWWSWYGGYCYGPRFFLFAALPAALGLALWAEHARSALSALAASLVLGWAFWTGFAGLVYGLGDLGICSERKYRLEAFCWYVPEFSPLIHPMIKPRDLEPWEWWAAAAFCAAYLRIALPLWVAAVRGGVRASRQGFSRLGGAWRAYRL